MAYPIQIVIPDSVDLLELQAKINIFNRDVWEVMGRCKTTILFYEALMRDFTDVITKMAQLDPQTANLIAFLNAWKENVKAFATFLPYLSNNAAYIVGWKPTADAPLQLGLARHSQILKMEAILGQKTGEEIIEQPMLDGELGQFPIIGKVALKFRHVIVTVAKVVAAGWITYVGREETLKYFDLKNEQVKVELQRKILQFLEQFSKSDPEKAEKAAEILKRIEQIAKETNTKSWIEKITGINFGETTKAFAFGAGLGIGILLLFLFSRRR